MMSVLLLQPTCADHEDEQATFPLTNAVVVATSSLAQFRVLMFSGMMIAFLYRLLNK